MSLMYTLHWRDAAGQKQERQVEGEEAAVAELVELAKIDPGCFGEAALPPDAPTQDMIDIVHRLNEADEERDTADLPADDRIIYLAVRYRGDEGMFVEGGYNASFDKVLSTVQKKAVLDQAINAVLANAVAMFPDDEEYQELLKQTGIGEGKGPNWHKRPLTPP